VPAPRQIFQSDLPPVAAQEAVFFTVEFAPGQALPWHVHPEGHELVYVLEGALTIEDQNHKITLIKAGEVNHVAPNVGHAARNDGTTALKALVVRVKDKSKPVVAPFQP
jgi:quercetin dioxygenase-like cupin family protein